jgi:hypothetical protein
MKNNLKIISIIILFIFCSGCEYDKVKEIAPPANVSFSKDIMPIFNNSCNSASCHATGGISPDLTKDNAYNELLLQSFVDTVAPKNSILYQDMIGKGNTMPPSGILSGYETGLVLKWIESGAKDN